MRACRRRLPGLGEEMLLEFGRGFTPLVVWSPQIFVWEGWDGDLHQNLQNSVRSV